MTEANRTATPDTRPEPVQLKHAKEFAALVTSAQRARALIRASITLVEDGSNANAPEDADRRMATLSDAWDLLEVAAEQLDAVLAPTTAAVEVSHV